MYHNRNKNITVQTPKNDTITLTTLPKEILGDFGFPKSSLRDDINTNNKEQHNSNKATRYGSRKGSKSFYMRAIYTLKDDHNLSVDELKTLTKKAFNVDVSKQDIYNFRYNMRKRHEMEQYSCKAKLTDFGLTRSTMILVFPHKPKKNPRIL